MTRGRPGRRHKILDKCRRRHKILDKCHLKSVCASRDTWGQTILLYTLLKPRMLFPEALACRFCASLHAFFHATALPCVRSISMPSPTLIVALFVEPYAALFIAFMLHKARCARIAFLLFALQA
jgi:hypothetical protein